MIKLFISPSYNKPDKADGGIRRVVDAMRQHLPTFGIEVVDSVEAADIVNCHAASYVDTQGKPMVASCHGLYWTDYNWQGGFHHVNQAVIETMARSTAVTVPSNWVGHAISRGMLVTPQTVYHGVNVDEWQRPAQHRGYVLYNKARADIISNPHHMQDVAELLPDVQFVSTIGEKTENITITGTMSYTKMKRYVREAAVYLCTARETFGIGTLEAMAAGVPVAGWRFGGQEEIIIEGETGYLAPFGDYEALAECIKKCLADRDRLSQNCIKGVSERWQWVDKIEQYANIFKAVYAEYTQKRPKVSVIMPCYNLAKYMDLALESVRRQTMGDFECLMIDDQSTDGTAVIADKWVAKDKRFKYLRTPHNLKLCGARNFGFSHSNGRYIIFLDADDMLTPKALETLSNHLDENDGTHIAYGRLDLINEPGTSHKEGLPIEQFDWFGQMSHLHQFPLGASLMRRRVMANSGGFRVRDWRAEDAAWVARVTSLGFRAHRATTEAMLWYRVRSDSKSVVESRNYRDRDGDWLAWYGWRLADTAENGRKVRAKNITPNWKTTPFGAQGKPSPHWNTSHYQDPAISIIIPVGPGHEHYLIDCLDSLLAQSVTNWEAVVINDTGKPIDTSFAPWAKVYNTSGGTGAGYARNLGIEKARGDLLLFLDCDDWMLSNCLQAMLSAFLETNGTRYIYSDYIDLDNAGKTKKQRMKTYDQSQWKGQHSVSILIPKEWATAVGGFDEKMGAWEDWDFPLKLAVNGYCGYHIPDITFVYRVYSGQRREYAFDGENGRALLRSLKDRYESYYTGAKEMCNCGKTAGGRAILKAKAAYTPQTAVSFAVPSINKTNGSKRKNNVTTIRLKYVGNRQASAAISRVNGKQLSKTYRFSKAPSRRYADAPESDAVLLETFSYIERVERATTTPVNMPDIPKVTAANIDPKKGIDPQSAGEAARVNMAKMKAAVTAEVERTIAADSQEKERELNITGAAARIASNADIDPSTITGTGKGGKITVMDVRNAIRELQHA